jgi:CubicO group peptidase (beta-lactamase class C family)
MITMLSRKTVRALLAIGLIVVPSPLLADQLATAVPEEVGMSSERLRRIGPVMEGYVERHEVPGVVTLAARSGKIVHFESVGYRDLEAKSPLTRDTIFRIASMTKACTTVALMTLVEEGRILLSDPVSRWIPEFTEVRVASSAESGGDASNATTPAVRPMTVWHLLTHTAGLPNVRQRTSFPGPGETVGQWCRRVATIPLRYQPGEAWEYSCATTVAGHLIEIITGRDLDQALRELVFDPLAMTDSSFYIPASKADHLSAAYQPLPEGGLELGDPGDERSRFVDPPRRIYNGAGGLLSTAPDYYRMLQMLLDGGELDDVRLLGRKTVEHMTTNQIGNLANERSLGGLTSMSSLIGPGHGFGLGFAVVIDPGQSRGFAAQPVSRGAYSWGGGFGTFFWVDPEEEIIGIVMIQVWRAPEIGSDIRNRFATLVYQAVVE